VLFLGDHAYGAAAQVTEVTEQALTVELAVSLLNQLLAWNCLNDLLFGTVLCKRIAGA
jgi:hypothetical protein